MCIMAIGVGQLIGKCVGRDPRTGRFISLTKRTQLGTYTDVEPIELESRPNPRKAPAVAARLVLGLTLLVITAPATGVAFAAKVAALLGSAGVKAARWTAGYIHREFVAQWWLAAFVLAPCGAFLAWLATR
jgi:hypothetical protein